MASVGPKAPSEVKFYNRIQQLAAARSGELGKMIDGLIENVVIGRADGGKGLS